jgi:hypothetical protein
MDHHDKTDFPVFIHSATLMCMEYCALCSVRDPVGKLDPCPYLVKGAYWINSNCEFLQYCDSNIGLFSIAPPLAIALPTLR